MESISVKSTVLAFEALSRGPKGSGLEGADALFGAADEHHLSIELDRLCRRLLRDLGRRHLQELIVPFGRLRIRKVHDAALVRPLVDGLRPHFSHRP